MTAREDSDTKGIWKVIGASAGGTMIEWYDFYIFGSLATVAIDTSIHDYPKN